MFRGAVSGHRAEDMFREAVNQGLRTRLSTIGDSTSITLSNSYLGYHQQSKTRHRGTKAYREIHSLHYALRRTSQDYRSHLSLVFILEQPLSTKHKREQILCSKHSSRSSSVFISKQFLSRKHCLFLGIHTYPSPVKPSLSLWTTFTCRIHSCAQSSGAVYTSLPTCQVDLHLLMPLRVSSTFPSPTGAEPLPQASICGWIIRGQGISPCLPRQTLGLA